MSGAAGSAQVGDRSGGGGVASVGSATSGGSKTGNGSATGNGLARGRSPEEPRRIPIVSMILMAVFLTGGSVGLLADWPAGPGNLDWGVWVVLYGGYAYVIGAAILHARTGR